MRGRGVRGRSHPVGVAPARPFDLAQGEWPNTAPTRSFDLAEGERKPHTTSGFPIPREGRKRGLGGNGSGEELSEGVLAQVSVFLDGVGVDV